VKIKKKKQNQENLVAAIHTRRGSNVGDAPCLRLFCLSGRRLRRRASIAAGPWTRAAASSPASHAAAVAPWTRAARSSGCLPPDHIAVAAPWIEHQSPSALLQVETKIPITSPCSSPRAATMPMPMLRERLRTRTVRQCERRAREPEA
jgi:hypothetical protein